MQYSFNRLLPWAAILSVILTAGTSFAQDAATGKYFTVTVHQGIGRQELLRKLRADYFLKMGPAFPTGKESDADALLSRTLDAIYLAVSDVLDIHMYSFSVDLEIFPDKRALGDELQACLGRRLDAPSFYFYDRNKIYIAYDEMTVGMLSHETAHAIISHYFVVQPPVKVQEILAGYVEYSMRKNTKESLK